ncbi:MAG: OsmC family protein [Patescibacteria group bacterium]
MTTSRITYEGDLRTTCTHLKSQNQIITDAPIDNHGKGEAFSPTDLLATSLVSCMMTIMGIKAKKEGIPFTKAEAEMQKVMAEDPRRVSEIVVTIKMPKETYSNEQKKILENAALNCPVAKSLNSEIKQTIKFEYQ